MVDAGGDEGAAQPGSGRLNRAVARGQPRAPGDNEQGGTGVRAAGAGQVQRSVEQSERNSRIHAGWSGSWRSFS